MHLHAVILEKVSIWTYNVIKSIFGQSLMRPPPGHLAKQHNEGKIGQAAFQAFLSIANQWDLNREQQKILLGSIPSSTYHVWKNNAEKACEFKLPKDTLERISYLLGIYKALNILLPTREAANQWIKRPNSASLFNHQSALHKILGGNVVDLADVRRYLDAQRG